MFRRSHEVSIAKWSPDGTRIVVADYFTPSFAVLDADTGDTLFRIPGHETGVLGAAWSPDGTAIAIVGGDSTAKIKIWDAATGQLIRSLGREDLRNWLVSVAWAPDGERIATYGEEGIGRIWDAITGEELLTFAGHTSHAYLCWPRTGERILTASWDGTVRVWDVAAGLELVRYDVGSPVLAEWSPDGKQIAVSSKDGMLRVFPAWQTTQELIDYAKECCAVRELTAEEREQFGLEATSGGLNY